MSVIITQVMATDKETEEKLSENERKSVKHLKLLTNQATECESSQVNLQVIGGSSGSLYSLTESVSIPMSDSYISTEKEETKDSTDWDADYKLGYTGSMDLLGNNDGMKVINVLDHSLNANIKGSDNLSKVLISLLRQTKNDSALVNFVIV